MATNEKPRKRKATPVSKHRTKYVGAFVEVVTNLENTRAVARELTKKLLEVRDVEKNIRLATKEEAEEFASNYRDATAVLLEFEDKYQELRTAISNVVIPKKRDEQAENDFNASTYLLTSEITQLATKDLIPVTAKVASCVDIYINLAERASKDNAKV